MRATNSATSSSLERIAPATASAPRGCTSANLPRRRGADAHGRRIGDRRSSGCSRFQRFEFAQQRVVLGVGESPDRRARSSGSWRRRAGGAVRVRRRSCGGSALLAARAQTFAIGVGGILCVSLTPLLQRRSSDNGATELPRCRGLRFADETAASLRVPRSRRARVRSSYQRAGFVSGGASCWRS